MEPDADVAARGRAVRHFDRMTMKQRHRHSLVTMLYFVKSL